MIRNNTIAGCLLIWLLALVLGSAGCTGTDYFPPSSGDQTPGGGDQPPPPPPPPPQPVEFGTAGVTSPYSPICYSCHQTLGDRDWVRGHVKAIGGDLYGDSQHGEEFSKDCTLCHGAFRVGGRPEAEGGGEYSSGGGFYPSPHAGARHGATTVPKTHEAAIDGVVVNDGMITVTFTVEDYQSSEINSQFTIAKWVEVGGEGSWINLLPTARMIADTRVTVGGGSWPQEGGNAVVGGLAAGDATTFTHTLPYDFREGPIWENPEDKVAANYCEGNNPCINYVKGIIERIDTDGAWDGNGAYRIGVAGSAGDNEQSARFTAVADFSLHNGIVADGVLSPPAPYVQIGQASCTSCHSTRLVFPRNNVHDQQYTQVGVCATCHNRYTYDRGASRPTSGDWVNISLNMIIHSLHSGVKGYTVDGKEYENVGFPDWTAPGTANCTACHVGEIPASGTGWNRKDEAVMETCNTCHGPGGYPVGTHPSSAPWPYCWECHNDNDPWSEMPGFESYPALYHRIGDRLDSLRAQRENYHFKLVGVENAVFDATPVVRWQVLDATGNPYHLWEEIDIDGGPQIQIGWGLIDDWINEGSGEKGGDNDDGGRPVVLNVATSGENINTVISADGRTATSTFPAFTDVETGKDQLFANLAAAREGRRGFVAIQRRIRDNNGVRHLLTSLVQPITLGAGTVKPAAPRRNTVRTSPVGYAFASGSCLDCHGTIAWHGGSYTADHNIQGCITCHNAGSHRSISGMEEGAAPYSMDMMYLMHKIHAAPATLYPGSVAGNCHACHSAAGDVTGPSGQINCSTCHNAGLNQGRLGVISDWPGAIDRYGLRGPE